MNAIKHAKKIIANDPSTGVARTLADLVISLESGRAFELNRMYDLNMKEFELAIDILSEWRLDRYYAGKSKLLDLSIQVCNMDETDSTSV